MCHKESYESNDYFHISKGEISDNNTVETYCGITVDIYEIDNYMPTCYICIMEKELENEVSLEMKYG